jgi:hypothetical protein
MRLCKTCGWLRVGIVRSVQSAVGNIVVFTHEARPRSLPHLVQRAIQC